jgi:hypothetical protein
MASPNSAPPPAPAPPAAPNPTQGEPQGPPGRTAETIPHDSSAEEPRPAESEEDIPTDDTRAG